MSVHHYTHQHNGHFWAQCSHWCVSISKSQHLRQHLPLHLHLHQHLHLHLHLSVGRLLPSSYKPHCLPVQTAGSTWKVVSPLKLSPPAKWLITCDWWVYIRQLLALDRTLSSKRICNSEPEFACVGLPFLAPLSHAPNHSHTHLHLGIPTKDRNLLS